MFVRTVKDYRASLAILSESNCGRNVSEERKNYVTIRSSWLFVNNDKVFKPKIT